MLRPSSQPFSKRLFFRCAWCLDQTFACPSLVRLSFRVWVCSSLVPPWVAAALNFHPVAFCPTFPNWTGSGHFWLVFGCLFQSSIFGTAGFCLCLGFVFFQYCFWHFQSTGLSQTAFMLFLGPMDPKDNLVIKVSFSFEPKFSWGSARIMWVQTRNWFGFKQMEFPKNISNQKRIEKNSLEFKKIT